MQTKFKTAVNAAFLTVFIIFNIIILLLLTSKIFVTVYTGVYFGLFLLVVDAVIFIPMFFVTGYEFKDDELIIRDWPFKKYKIAYDDIFALEDGDFEAKDKHIVALSMNRLAIGYKEKKNDTEKEMYMYISPAEMSLFIIRLDGRLKQSAAELKQKAKEMSASQAEHEKKKKQWQNKKAEMKEKSKPEIIEANGVNKFSGFTDSKSDDVKNEK